MNLHEMFPSNYLTKDDLPTPRTLTISNVTRKEVWRKNGKQLAVILHFGGNVKPLVLNKTNAIVIARLYGNDTALWASKPIEVYHDPGVMLGRERVGGLRVRIATVLPNNVTPSPPTPLATAKPPQHVVDSQS
jgi:hypothetical protein